MTANLDHSPADIIAQLLVDLSLGSNPEGTAGDTWPVFYADMPDSPDDLISVYEQDGIIEGFSQIDGEPMEHLGIQVLVRASRPKAGSDKARDVSYNLDQVVLRNTVTLDSNTYEVHNFTKTSGPTMIGKEEGNSRVLFSLNGLIALRQTS